MSIDNSIVALSYILTNDTDITDLLAFYPDTTIPLIKAGRLAKTDDDLPCISFTRSGLDLNMSSKASIFTVNCYAGNDTDQENAYQNSNNLAETLVKKLQGNQYSCEGYPVTTSARIITSVDDPAAKEVNTVVEVRLYNIGGAI